MELDAGRWKAAQYGWLKRSYRMNRRSSALTRSHSDADQARLSVDYCFQVLMGAWTAFLILLLVRGSWDQEGR